MTGKNIICGLGFLLFVYSLPVDEVSALDSPLFGPVRYDVRARYGRENRYRESIRTSGGPHVIKLQNGERTSERTDLLELSLNGAAVLRLRHYAYSYLACFVRMEKENALELMIRDYDPPAFKRPALMSKHVSISVSPAAGNYPVVVLGAESWDSVFAYMDSILRIRSAETAALARDAANLQNEDDTRTRAMMLLGERSDGDARIFLLHVIQDHADRPDVRGEAALALGRLRVPEAVPFLFQGLLDPNEKIRIACARALSHYDERDTRELLTRMLHEMDAMMSTAVMRTMARAGWQPVGTLLELADAADVDVANMSIELLIGSRDARTVERMLDLLNAPGPRDVTRIIAVLRECGDGRAVKPLTRIAMDPAARKGMELDLAIALAVLGDQQSAELVGDLINRVDTRHPAYNKLLMAYKKMIHMD